MGKKRKIRGYNPTNNSPSDNAVSNWLPRLKNLDTMPCSSVLPPKIRRRRRRRRLRSDHEEDASVRVVWNPICAVTRYRNVGTDGKPKTKSSTNKKNNPSEGMSMNTRLRWPTIVSRLSVKNKPNVVPRWIGPKSKSIYRRCNYEYDYIYIYIYINGTELNGTFNKKKQLNVCTIHRINTI